MTKHQPTPPGPGPWECDYSHFDRPLPRYATDVFCQGFTEGQAMGFERAGFPVKTIAMRIVDGFPYVQIQPLLGSPADTKLPPRWLFKLVGVFHPVLRKRYRTAKAYLEGKKWREEVREWDEVLKPRLIATLEALSAVDPTALDDEGLLEHLDGCRAALLEDMHIHFIINPTTVLPVGRFLARAESWTGASTSDLLSLVSEGAETQNRELRQLAESIRDSGSQALIAPNGVTDKQAIERLCATEGEVGRAARAWFAAMSVRQLSAGDLSTPNGGEVPELLMANLRQEVAGRSQRRAAAADAEAMRRRVPEDKRAEFDELRAEARTVYRLRDERCSELDAWTMGLCRRGVLEAGRRLVERGLVHKDVHALELDHDELVALMKGKGGPSADELAEREQFRARHVATDAPMFIGGEAPKPPPLDYFPAHVAEMMQAVFRYIDDMNGTMEPDASEEPTVLGGRPASGGTVRGPARLVGGPADFGKVQKGDILVARATMPSYNGVLPLLSGIVTDFGGALCHAAIVAREFGIPAVVNTRTATQTIRDGDTIEIDGDRGTVRICS